MRSRFYCFAALCVSIAAVGCGRVPNVPNAISTEATTLADFNAAGAPTVEFSAPDMMCAESCAKKVKEVLSGQPGAKEVVVDFDSKTAKVAIEKDGQFDANAAIAALVDHGFKNSAIKSGAPSPASAKP
jgi:copper chaperone CopZ